MPEPLPPVIIATPDLLRALVRDAVLETLARVREIEQALPEGVLAIDEPRAAHLLGLRHQQLKKARQAGEITASRITGRRIRYTRADLVDYLVRKKESA